VNGAEDLQAQADRLLERRGLGRSRLMHILFNLLLTRTLNGETASELEIAQAVFRRDDQFDSSIDATVRVYVHRLRRKLDEYYSGSGSAEVWRLTVPPGEYRLTTERRTVPVGPVRTGRRAKIAIVALAAALAISLAAWPVLWFAAPADRERTLRQTALWAPIVDTTRPTLIVLGDYYIFGDTGGGVDVQRLVREFPVNSQNELDEFVMARPDLAGRYVDLDLHYLPVGAAAALANILPVLRQSGRDTPRVITMSELRPEMLRFNNIVYIGYLSGLGLLQDRVFAGSRFAMGDTPDELIDSRSGKHFVSQAGDAVRPGTPNRDYAYFSSFAGPTGTRVVIVAGTRDMGLAGAAKLLTDAGEVNRLGSQADGGRAFEVLYGIEGLGRTGMKSNMELASPLRTSRIWAAPLAPGH
jgi:hypothetical protein